MASVHKRVVERHAIAAIDIHNNTGRNPHYGVVCEEDERVMALASMFGPIAVLFRGLPGTQTASFAGVLPALTVECGQSGIDANAQKAADLILKLKKMGCHFALDDFGSGHTRFSQVLELPCDVVKLDRRLVRCIDSSARSNRYLRSIVECFSALGATTVAEGVETLGQFEFLQRIGCHQGQGYLWAAAMDDNSFLDGLRRRCA